MRALRTIAVGLGLSAYFLTEAGGRMASRLVQYSDELGLVFIKPIAEPVIAATALGAPAYLAPIPVLTSLAVSLFAAGVVWPIFENTIRVTIDGAIEAVSAVVDRLSAGTKSSSAVKDRLSGKTKSGSMPGSRLPR